MTKEIAKKAFRPRDPEANKGDFGYVCLVGGSLSYSGAIRLANMAACALRAGAGVVTIASPESVCRAIVPQILESTLYPLSETAEGFFRFREAEFEELAKRYDVIAFGMGVGNTDETEKTVRWLLANYTGTLILDADGLNALSRILAEKKEETCGINKSLISDEEEKRSGYSEANGDLSNRAESGTTDPDCGVCSPRALILTPHAKEFSRLSGLSVEDVKKASQEAAKELARKLGAIVLLKGHTTVIADGRADAAGNAERTENNAGGFPSGSKTEISEIPFALSDTGTPGMATGGSGDVLSGVLAALCAQNPDNLFLATAAAAYVNGFAGELAAKRHGEISMTAGDTAREIETAVRLITGR